MVWSIFQCVLKHYSYKTQEKMKPFLILLALSITANTVLAAPPDAAQLPHLTLQQAEQLWTQHNRELQLARDQVEAAAADKLGAAQRPNPQLSLNTTGIGTGRDHRYLGGSDTVLRLDQTFERGGKRQLRMRGADLRHAAAKQDMQDALRQGRIALQQAYFDLVLAQEKHRIAEDNAHLFGQTVEASQLRLKAGDIAPSELSRIQVDALRAENDVRQAVNDEQQAQAALAYLIGAEADARAIHAEDAWPGSTVPATTAGDIDNRPDVRSAVLRVQAAESARDLAQSLKTRDVTIGVQVEHNGMDQQSNTVGFGVSVPLMTGYEYQGEIGRAEADLMTARDDLERIRAQALTDINKARADLEAAAERVQRFDGSLLAEAQRSLDAAEFAYGHGALSVMDLLDARRTFKATQVDAVTARADYAKALAAWRYAIGEGEPQ
jgi:cobalt-zinc-cadmium efflux system outer membrane protein